MIDFADWLACRPLDGRPALVLGKGPTFNAVEDVDLDAYNVVTLNHTVNEVRDPDIAHIIDLDVAETCADTLRDGPRWVLMPRHPHVDHVRSLRPLEDFFDAVPILREISDDGRLVCYDAIGAPALGRGPMVDVVYFSSEAVFSILGHLGVGQVVSLGVDGGTSYGSAFAALDRTTRLANGQPSFDVQFDRIAAIAEKHGIEWRPLVEPLRIFIGAAERDRVAVRVLEHSIRAHATVPVRVIPMFSVDAPVPKRRANRARTPFSFSRFAIPAACGYRGRAVYLDSDMLVFGDVAELADAEFDGSHVLCTVQGAAPPEWADNDGFHAGPQFSVMVLDCEKLDWTLRSVVDGLDSDRYTYEELLFGMCIVDADKIAGTLPPSWNHLEHLDDDTRLLHYTIVPTQPWRSDDNPLGPVWEAAYRRAVADGAVPRDEVDDLVERGLVKASLIDPFTGVAESPNRLAADPLLLELRATRDELTRIAARTPGGLTRNAARRVRDHGRRLQRLHRSATPPVRRIRQSAMRTLRFLSDRPTREATTEAR